MAGERRGELQPTTARAGWRLAALAVAGLLVGLVAFARLGAPDTSPPAAPVPPVAPVPPSVVVPSSAPSAVAVGTRPLRPSSAPRRVIPVSSRDIEFAYSPWPDRYADGIPRSIDGQLVERLPRALDTVGVALSGLSEAMLVGGWYAEDRLVDVRCLGALPCSGPRLADAAADLDRGGSVPVSGLNSIGDGARVLKVRVEAACGPSDRPTIVPDCQYTLHADAALWVGDELTDASPIGPAPLLSRLGAIVPAFDPRPFHDLPVCRLPRPAQTYASLYSSVQLAFVFRSTADREQQTTAVLNGPPFGHLALDCAPRPPLDGRTGWISRDNVLLRVTDVHGSTGDRVRALLEALSDE